MSQDKQERISIRASEEQKRVLRQAAELTNLSVSEFMLQHSLHAAGEQVDRVMTWKASRAQLDQLAAALDSPPKVIPQLRRLFETPSVLETPPTQRRGKRLTAK